MASVVVIGLGAMGGSIALRLTQSGFNVHGSDISQSAIDRFISEGGKASNNLDAVSSAQFVITSLPNDEILWSMLRSGLMEKLRPDQTLIEMSTILPQTMEAVAAELKDKVAEIIDSPVSGGPNEARKGILSLLVGVEGELRPASHDLLSKVGSVNLVGTVGSGKALKLVNNMISLGITAVAIEGFQLGAKLGIDQQKMYDVLSKSSASSLMFNKRGPLIIQDDFAARFAVYLAEKDTGLALKIAHETRYPTPLLANVHQRYEAALARGLGQEDVAALAKLYRD